ncbi:DUF5131 family protein [Klebsiella pneumoniae subsp. pneumoniae]
MSASPTCWRRSAAVRFISAEPLLGPLDIASWLAPVSTPGHCISIDGDWWHAPGSCPNCRPRLDWVIVGGESGPRARPMHPDWVRKIRDQCTDAAVPFHFKQWGEWLHDDYLGWWEHGDDALENCQRVGNFWRVGKARAGRHLDGVEHLAFPGDKA